MAIINGVFVNLGCCGYHESADGIGGTSFSGYRNFGKHEWPQMDIGGIEFYNPRTCADEASRNRRLTRNQAIWLTERIYGFTNTLTIPNEDEFDGTENGRLLLREQTNNSFDTDEYKLLHSLEASLTEVARDHPEWMRPCDHQALINARARLAQIRAVR